jgi:predicted amidohydrolase
MVRRRTPGAVKLWPQDDMKICAAQTRPLKGDLQGNIANHKTLIAQAVADGADLIVFPELSVTGYEPTLAAQLAMGEGDRRLDGVQAISDANDIAIGVGVPTECGNAVRISLLLFRPREARFTYSKTYLHRDEESFFVPGRSSPHVQVKQTRVALAICYEISVTEHLQSVLKSPPDIYIASVVKFVNGFDKALARLAGIARDGSMPVMMANSVGVSDGHPCAGKTSVWNREGSLIGQLNDSDQGLLTFDTETQRVIERIR